ncbi:DNA topoisomerase IV subunit A [Haloimpatiens sp. FM7315]|uniref:DNA topoisomerase IV subunit A n=1 Tax=Haloimpatiens sp. FM7315 TaxID=3298609 RepID=UPI00370B0BA2
MAKKIDIPRDNNIIEIPIEDAMPENYLPYAVEVAKDRALPDVRDGLKPVHRRILYGAYMLKAFPDKPYFKSARIVGDILGKFHPHGDTSVYDALVILAQNFSTRYPLIDGHGNWGSVDGDGAAAMRYTEARLTPISMEMLKDIDKDVVDMVDNYSETEKEPKVLPGRYPNLLVNGTFGIAVGLSTNIPPHNLGEVIDGTIAYMENKDISIKELMNYIKGPDLPTGGVLIGKNSILSSYETGEGKVTLRAKTSIEKLENGRYGIVIWEFPYRKNKAKILQSISEMTADKKHQRTLDSITDIRDESDRNGIRAVIEFKKSIEKDIVQKVLKYLLKKTDLQCNLNFNMVALSDGKPQTMTLKDILRYYVKHQEEVITRRTLKQLEIAKKRFHIVEGFIKAIDIMDEIIATIRASKSKSDSENNLEKEYGFTKIQAEAIVELMLYKLTGLEIKVFEKEYKELEKKIVVLEKILSSEIELYKVIKKELLEVKNKFNDKRRSEIIKDDNEAKIEIDEIIIEEDNIITISNEGYAKRISNKSYIRTNLGVEDIEYREGDFNKYFIETNTKNTLLIFTDKGNMYQTKVIAFPELKWKEKGEKIDSIIKGLNLEKENIVDVYSIDSFKDDRKFVFITDCGFIKKSNLNRFDTSYSKIQALSMKKDERLLSARLSSSNNNEKFIRIITETKLDFTIEEPKIEEGDRNIKGTLLVQLGSKDKISLVEFKEEYIKKEVYIKISKNGDIKATDKKLRGSFKVSERGVILIFDNKGMVHKIPSYMLQNIGKDKFNLKNILENFNKDSIILNVLLVESFEESLDIYFFSENGYVKKTSLKDFDGNYVSTLAYKFRNEGDTLVNVEESKSHISEDVVIVTEKAMIIRFNTNTINYMGKVASGVTGISLKEDDSVIFASLILDYNGDKENCLNEIAVSSKENQGKIIITTNKNNINEIDLNDVKSQNRAGRGKNAILVGMDEILNKVEYINKIK